MTRHKHLLLLQLFRNVASGRSRDFDPSLGKQRARGEHEGEIKYQGVMDSPQYLPRMSAAKYNTPTHRLALIDQNLPKTLAISQQLDEEVTSVSFVQQLRDEVHVGNQSRLEDDWHVRRVEQFDRVVRHHPTVTLRSNR